MRVILVIVYAKVNSITALMDIIIFEPTQPDDNTARHVTPETGR